MKKAWQAVAALGAMGLFAAVLPAQASPLVARTNINGFSRLNAHHTLVQYCRSHGYGIRQDSLRTVVCAKMVHGAPKSYLAETLGDSPEPFSPQLSLHFKFFPRKDGRMHIEAQAWCTVNGRDEYEERSPALVTQIQKMLTRSRHDWYRNHPELVPGRNG
ncbi:hypothetical protein [Oleiagrimonas sp. C23AA]|uniref:hypothetical protein n=1 Tax=Oleiagrimonas sp. C23AA TaxID=2719047 RepID=UPI00141F82D1|nr:hypothetical protein [Oleiagrimonas sp. C23AA]NII09118.1 hypothetical protein [Oleiagrimonas sp. C23AA]